MRRATGLAYLLARASDTLADSSVADVAVRMNALERFRMCVSGDAKWAELGPEVLDGVGDSGERGLLQRMGRLMDELWGLPEEQVPLVREVLCTIIDGQRLDLQRFAEASADAPVALASEEELDDYTWRVAGCVGAFWTKIGYATLGHQFSALPQDALLSRADAYGRGLQLVNILRDLPQDLAQGRCYLPVEDPLDRDTLMKMHQRYVIRAQAKVRQAAEYTSCLKGRRVKVASGLPAMIAGETLELLEGVSWEQLEARVKVKRSRVYALAAKEMFGS